jgi:RNA polymerase sigma-70 factor (ECF subfamily)
LTTQVRSNPSLVISRWHRGTPWRLVATRANGQPAFGCYLPCPHTEVARPGGLLVLTLAGTGIAEITWFADSSVFPHFGLPRTLRSSAQNRGA